MVGTACAIVLDRSAQRMGLLDRVFAWFAAKAGAKHAQQAVYDSPLAIGLALGALLLLAFAILRATRS